MDKTTLSSKGQVIIPAKIRRRLGLGPRTRLEVEERDGEILLRPIRDDDWRDLRGAVSDESLTTALDDERRRERERGK